ncbi:head-tail connector protein [Devosia sp. RR2S18]|uniref:head-tail connector protein n=1 Tax=Devosia rhizosphaerae TaxID=3049774 RepID=UPI00253FC87F|nr:head-tail connector protein [Devosia sp. RR2S18]WIJ24231.1 head-tail connector protein [Devosia sp. RR2S18]
MTALTDLRAQLNIIDDNADDELLTRKIAAAEASVAADIGAETPVIYGDAPADLQEAILMKAAHLFENREAVLVGVGAQELPLGYADLIAPHRKWVF